MSAIQQQHQNRLVLNLQSAADLMTSDPITVRGSATLKEAIGMMVESGISALPVVDEDGKAVGVLSQTDIAIHDHNKPTQTVPEYYTTTDSLTGGTRLLARFSLDHADSTRVHELMTPTVFAVRPGDPVARVVGDMVALKIHRLFVTDHNGSLRGVISAFDVLRKLRSKEHAPIEYDVGAPAGV